MSCVITHQHTHHHIQINPAAAVQLPSTRNLTEISTFLHSFPINSIVLGKVHEQIEEFEKTYVLVKGYEEHAADKVKALSVKALEDLGIASHTILSIRKFIRYFSMR